MADIRITGRMVNFSRLTFETNDLGRIRQQLSTILAGDDYTGTLVIIDSTVEQDLIELIQLLLEFKLQPIAAVDGVLGQDARTIQFPIIPPDQPIQRITASSQNTEEPTVQVSKAKPTHTVYHDEMLRTGQSLIEENGDIVLTSSMNSGSEMIASGNIYIYGTARGRVIAGASGEQNARIFCHQLESELISIAGTFCVADDIPKEYLKKAVQIYLNQHQELVFEPLAI
ncbi:MAG: septum site-determining protein MinC [Acinetobacter sp.]|jgi:septum site-determining protein MinC|nr:MAG: septum site-determining protein MinC [Acinetobacter sp.]